MFSASHTFCMMPVIIATSDEHRAFLMSDAGHALRSLLLSGRGRALLPQVLVAYARLQQETPRHIEPLLAAGVTDLRPVQLQAAYARLLRRRSFLSRCGLTAAEWQALDRMQGVLVKLESQLQNFGLPSTLEHSDFHDNNILVDGKRVVINDWAESAITHPFFSLSGFCYSLTKAHPWLAKSHHCTALRHAYFAAWGDYGSLSDLEEAYVLTERLVHVRAALAYYHLWQCGRSTRLDFLYDRIANTFRRFVAVNTA